ncbi:MAG: mechanosensitive ion channel family protein [Flavobacteriales bacterium]|nr:mechanosensitive ion channel family protein [Flavobacteriales bacterium]MCB9447916.1 mechanosensitive ion channel family protein [Flavobacteriales bacterium]
MIAARRHLWLISLFLIFLTAAGGAQNPTQANLASPYQTIMYHISNLQPDQYQPEAAGRALLTEPGEDAAKLAVKLKQVLDGEGLWIDKARIPNDPNYEDSISGLHRYILFPEFPDIFVERVNGKWYYSRRTVEVIPVLHKRVFPFGTDFLMNLFPTYGQKFYLGLQVWQYIGIFIIVLVCVVMHKLLSLLIRGLLVRAARRIYHQETDVDVALKAARPFSLLLISLLLTILVPVLLLPINMNRYVMLMIHALTPLFGTMFLYRMIDFVAIYFERLAERTENTLDDQLIPLIKKSLKIFIIITGSLFILQQLNVNVTTLLAGLTISGIAFALAAQDTIKNLFGSLMIFLDRPFQIGDWIVSDNIDGTVEEVGFRSTRIRTFANSLVYVPNGKIADATVDNMGRRVYRRFKTYLGVQYDTPPVLIEAFVDGLREIVKRHPNTRKDYYEIHLNDFAGSSLNILFYIFFDVPTWPQELKARHEIMLATIKLAETLGVQFAFPTQTLHVENFPGQPSRSQAYNTDMTDVKEKVSTFLQGLSEGDKDKNKKE